MFSVMLVDDEVWSLRGLERLLPWSDMGYHISGSYTDSVDALEAIERIHPDVVFTDIRMPEVSGIDLIARGSRVVPPPEFVVISGYNEFKYAQSAVHLGAFDYCLKPIDVEVGIRLLERLSARLKSRRRELDSRICRELLNGNTENLMLSKAVANAPQSASTMWMSIAIHSAHQELLEDAASSVPEVEYQLITPEVERSVLLLAGIDSKLRRVAESLSDSLTAVGLCGGVSTLSADRATLPHLVQEAEIAGAQLFIGPASGLIHYDAHRSESLEKLCRELDAALGAYNYLRGSLLIDRFVDVVRQEHLGLYHVVKFWNRFVNTIGEWKIDLVQTSVPDHLDYHALVSRFHSIDGLTVYMKNIVGRGSAKLRLRRKLSRNINARFIDLLEYVNRHYKSKLKLSELAPEYQLNFSYCCELFKRCTNGTFSDYVTGLRMKEALSLGKSGKFSAHEIAGIVGYTDYFYFSRKFKQYHGISPNQVRSVDPTHEE